MQKVVQAVLGLSFLGSLGLLVAFDVHVAKTHSAWSSLAIVLFSLLLWLLFSLTLSLLYSDISEDPYYRTL